MDSSVEIVDASPEEIGAGVGVDTYASKLRAGNEDIDERRAKVPIRAPVSEDGGDKPNGRASEDAAKSPVLVPIRAPVSEDVDGEVDGNGSSSSDESFDSALERIAASSTASFDSVNSPKAPREEVETARVMPKALVTADDEQSSSIASSTSSSSSSSSTVEDDDVPNLKIEEGSDVNVASPEAPEDGDLPAEDGDSNEEAVTPDSNRAPDDVHEVHPDEPDVHGSSTELQPDEPDVHAEVQHEEPNVPGSSVELQHEEPDVPTELQHEEPDVSTELQHEVPGSIESDVPGSSTEQPVGRSLTEEDVAVLEEPHEEEAVVESVEAEVPIVSEGAEVAENVTAATEDEETPTESEVLGSEHDADVVESDLEPDTEVENGDSTLEPESGHALSEADNDNRVLEQASDELHIEDEDSDEDVEDLPDITMLRANIEDARASSSNSSSKPSLGSAGPSLPAKPTVPARSLPSLESAPRNSQQQNSAPQPTANSTPAPAQQTAGPVVVQPAAVVDNPGNGDAADENQETREKLQLIRVKFLRLALRLGQSSGNVVVAQVLYRLGLAEQLRGGRSSSRNTAFSFDRANSLAEEQEAAGEPEVDFTCTIMVLGKTGVGKSATINSLFDEVMTETNAFSFGTQKVQEIVGTVHGIKLRVIDTPGLLPSVADQRHNERVMSSVKRFIKKSSPDIVLYFDRLDMQSRDYGDLPLLRTITDTFGAAIWFNAIVVLTHASSAPPDGPNGVPISYEMFVAQRSHIVQQTIRQAAGDMRLMNPVSLVENHSACRTNRAGERVLPNGQVWKPQLLLLCFASKILAEANSLLKLQESTPGKPFGMRSKVPPLPFLLSSLLQSRTPLKLPDENAADDDETDDDIEADDSEDEEEYDNLPPFRRLTREELDQLDKKNRAAYFEELRERERLFQKKQWKDELRRRKEAKKRASLKEEYQAPVDDGYDDENTKSAAVPVPLPDMALPPTFDSDNPTHRYRYLETANQWLVRPVLETHGWDHDNGYDGLNVEKVFVVANKVPASISGQVTKDKKEANVTMECAASLKHGEGKFTQVGFDAQTVGKDMSYTVRSETRFNNFKKNRTVAGLALTMLGETLAAGMKLEDRLMIGKRLKVVLNGGALTGKGDVAYGGTMEMSLRDKDFPISRTLTTLGFSVMNWHGDLALGGNLQSQFMVGRTMVVARTNLNNRGAGLITIKASSSEQLQMALIGLIPLVRAIVGHKIFGHSSSHHSHEA